MIRAPDSELCVRDWIAVRIVGRPPEQFVDPALEFFGERVLEAIGFGVGRVNADVEHLVE